MVGQKPDTLSIRLNSIALHINLYLHIQKRSSSTVHICFPSTSYVVIHPYLYKNDITSNIYSSTTTTAFRFYVKIYNLCCQSI